MWIFWSLKDLITTQHPNTPQQPQHQLNQKPQTSRRQRIYGDENVTKNKSFAQVVRGIGRDGIWKKKGGTETIWPHKNEGEVWIGSILQLDQTKNTWLRNCMVGRMIDPRNFSMTQERFHLEGFYNIKLRYLGDDMVLISENEGEQVADLLKGYEDWLSNMFIFVEE